MRCQAAGDEGDQSRSWPLPEVSVIRIGIVRCVPERQRGLDWTIGIVETVGLVDLPGFAEVIRTIGQETNANWLYCSNCQLIYLIDLRFLGDHRIFAFFLDGSTTTDFRACFSGGRVDCHPARRSPCCRLSPVRDGQSERSQRS